MLRQPIRLGGLLALAGCALLTASCGNKFVKEERLPESGATLEGTVTYAGRKVPFAQITVASSTAQAMGRIDEDGRYKVENVPVGEVKLAVNTAAGKGELMSKNMAQSQGKARTLPKVVEVPAEPGGPRLREDHRHRQPVQPLRACTKRPASPASRQWRTEERVKGDHARARRRPVAPRRRRSPLRRVRPAGSRSDA